MNDFLTKHPILGIGTSAGAGIVGFMDTLTPILTFVSLLIGIIIGGYTIYLKHLELKSKLETKNGTKHRPRTS